MPGSTILTIWNLYHLLLKQSKVLLNHSKVAIGACGGVTACGALPVLLRRRRNMQTAKGKPIAAPELPKARTHDQRQAPFVSQLQLQETVLGGSYARVCLAVDATGARWAVTVYSKKEVKSMKSGEAYMASLEDLGSRWEHPHILHLQPGWACDDCFIYTTTDFCPGGSLLAHLQQQGCFSDSLARACLAQVISALEYLHSFSVAYRILKSDAVLIDSAGLLKLSCSRFSKQLPATGRLLTLCAVNEYVAPEMLTSEGHGLEVDLWALGVLLFELLLGRTPFATGADEPEWQQVLHDRIMHSRFAWPEESNGRVAPEAQALVEALLDRSLAKRPLCSELLPSPDAEISPEHIEHFAFTGKGKALRSAFTWLAVGDANAITAKHLLPRAADMRSLTYFRNRDGKMRQPPLTLRETDESVSNYELPALQLGKMEKLDGKLSRVAATSNVAVALAAAVALVEDVEQAVSVPEVVTNGAKHEQNNLKTQEAVPFGAIERSAENGRSQHVPHAVPVGSPPVLPSEELQSSGLTSSANVAAVNSNLGFKPHAADLKAQGASARAERMRDLEAAAVRAEKLRELHNNLSLMADLQDIARANSQLGNYYSAGNAGNSKAAQVNPNMTHSGIVISPGDMQVSQGGWFSSCSPCKSRPCASAELPWDLQNPCEPSYQRSAVAVDVDGAFPGRIEASWTPYGDPQSPPHPRAGPPSSTPVRSPDTTSAWNIGRGFN